MILVLDPRISYEGLKMDYSDDPTLSDHLKDSKIKLFDYFDANYATLPNSMPSSPPSTLVHALPVDGSPQKSFTARYRRKMNYSTNELEEYFKLPAEDFQSCNPIQWWVGRRSQFPRLFKLARDILCIPG
jgi:hAT family C-terminal dimerisation region